MQTVQELRAKSLEINKQLQAIQAKGDDMAQADVLRYNQLTIEYETLQDEIASHTSQGRVTDPQPINGGRMVPRGDGGQPRAFAQPGAMFASASNETYGFHGFGDLVKAISGATRGKHDNRLQQLQAAGMNETTGSEGGYPLRAMESEAKARSPR